MRLPDVLKFCARIRNHLVCLGRKGSVHKKRSNTCFENFSNLLFFVRAETAGIAADWAANIAAVVRETFSEAGLLAGRSLGCGVGMSSLFSIWLLTPVGFIWSFSSFHKSFLFISPLELTLIRPDCPLSKFIIYISPFSSFLLLWSLTLYFNFNLFCSKEKNILHVVHLYSCYCQNTCTLVNTRVYCTLHTQLYPYSYLHL